MLESASEEDRLSQSQHYDLMEMKETAELHILVLNMVQNVPLLLFKHI